MNTSGSIAKLTLDGISFDVMADGNFSQVLSEYTNENQATSGNNILKKTKRPTNVEGVDVAANPDEAIVLAELARRTTPFPITWAEINGATWQNQGMIEFENRETESFKAALQLLPKFNKWEKF